MSSNQYFIDLYPIWKGKLSQAQGQVTFVSPYLTPRVADELIQLIPPERCTVYTRFVLEEFAFGSSSFRTVNHLVQSGYTVYMVDKLHSKIVLIHGEFASIGSQNLTQKGRQSVEASVVLNNQSEVAQLEEELAKSMRLKIAISLEMLDVMSKMMTPIRNQVRLLKSQSYILRQKHFKELLLAKLHSQLARREKIEIEKQLETIQAHLDGFIPDGHVPLKVAQYFIRKSARWTTHLGYNDVSSRGQSKNVYGINGKDWRIDFGGNTFLVGRAIQRCCNATQEMLLDAQAGALTTKASFYEYLEEEVCQSVCTFSDSENTYPYPCEDDYMKFGAQAIDVRRFLNVILKMIPDEFFLPEENKQP